MKPLRLVFAIAVLSAALTCRLRDALALIDVRVIDHLIVAGGQTISMAERGLI